MLDDMSLALPMKEWLSTVDNLTCHVISPPMWGEGYKPVSVAAPQGEACAGARGLERLGLVTGLCSLDH